MGMTEIDVTKVNTETGIKIGLDTAPTKIVEFVNLRCPYCKQWSDEKNDLLQELVNDGKIQRIIKLFDKEKPSLALGNIMHHHVPNDDSALAAILDIYKTQDVWGSFDSHEEVAKYAVDELQLTLEDYKTTSEAIVAETKESNVFFIPTMIVGEEVLDQKISTEELLALLDK